MTEDRIKEIIRWHGLTPETLEIAYREGVYDERQRCAKLLEESGIGGDHLAEMVLSEG